MVRQFIFAAILLLALGSKSECLAADEFRLGVATEGYTYFNRPGADLSKHNDDLRACLMEVAKVRSLDEQLSAGGIIDDLIVTAMSGGVRPSATENCMVVHGWRVVALPDAEGAALAKVTPVDLMKSLEPWIGADIPNGQVARVWNNDAATAVTKRFELRPASKKRIALSVLALGKITVESPEPPKANAPAIAKPLGKGQTLSAPQGMALLILQVKGMSMRNGGNMEFDRMTPDADTIAAGDESQPNAVILGNAFGGVDKNGTWRAFVIPPGRWRINALSSGIQFVNLCLGSPSFEVKEGEVIYGGAFDFSADSIGPGLSLESVRQWLNGQPAAEKVQPATYTNGWLGPCGNNSIYALEIKDAPFRDGYQWGSMANVPPVSLSTGNSESGAGLIP